MAARKKGISVKTFEKRIRVRQLTVADFDSLLELQELCFPGMKPWTREQTESQIEIFPEGQLCVEYQGKLVASSSSLIVEFSDFSDWHDWKNVADNGFIRTHDPEGDTLYGIEMMVHPSYRGMKLARRLYGARKELARERNLKRIIIGGRIPGYGDHADKMSAFEYAKEVIQKNLYDPVLTPQLANDFQLKGLIPNYLAEDDASRGYATHLEWTNLEHVPEGTETRSRTNNQVRLCVLQYELRNVSSFEQFEKQVDFFVDVASDYRSDFIVFPELFTLQLMSTLDERRPEAAARKLADYTPRYLELFNRLAVGYHVNIIGGSTFTMEDDQLYNVAYLFRRDGTIERQPKLHITHDERKWWGVSPGKSAEIFETDRGRIAIQLSYDVEFPELSRLASSRDVRILFVPFTTDERNAYLGIRYCAQARAVENDMYVALSGCVGNLPLVANADIHYAQSAILTPADITFSRDAVAAEATPNIEHVLVHDLDLHVLRRHKLMGCGWTDRRKDLYQLAITRDSGDQDFI